jgi:hypothetical protein
MSESAFTITPTTSRCLTGASGYIAQVVADGRARKDSERVARIMIGVVINYLGEGKGV